MVSRIFLIGTLGLCAGLVPTLAVAQSQLNPRDLTGAWEPFRPGRNPDPALAPPPPSPLVLKPTYAKPYETRRAAEAEAAKKGEPLSSANNAVLCRPYGMPTMMSVANYPVEILQTPGQVTIIAEAFSEVRRVFLDRPQAKIGEVAPGYYGRSIGRWDGNTLVVDTIGIKTSIPGYLGMPHSDQMQITERLHLIDNDRLHDEITIADPVVLEQPVTYTLAYRRLRDYEMVEFVCENNNEYVDEHGIVHMRLRER
jgi:hypothetical protein